MAIECAPWMRPTNLTGHANTASATSGTRVTPTFRQTNNAVPQTPVSTVNLTFTATNGGWIMQVVALKAATQ
jgi:hypothetical protein